MRGIGALSIGMLAALASCGGLTPTTYRFRMTVEVATPQGTRSGSSVYEVRAYTTGEILPDANKRSWETRGEAVAVELPGGRTLFALMKTGAMHGDMASLSMRALDPMFNNDIVESAERISRRQSIRSPAQVVSSDYPLLVTFVEITDPKSVVRVNPADLMATFGYGVRLKAITVQATDDPVTTGIKKRLPKPPYGRQVWVEGRQVFERVNVEDFMSGTFQ